MRNLTILLAALLCSAATLRASEPVGGPFVSNGLWDNWSVSLGTGAQVYIVKGGEGSIGDRTTVPVEISVTKWLHPVYGLRGQIGFGKNKSSAAYEWKQAYLHGDFMIDFCTAVAGYRPDRLYSALPYLGTGIDMMYGMEDRKRDHTAIHVMGLLNRFRLTEAFDVNLEMKLTVVDKSFARTSDGGFEGFFTTGVSVTWRIGEAGKKHFRRALTVQEIP